jgi:hypothetical protein
MDHLPTARLTKRRSSGSASFSTYNFTNLSPNGDNPNLNTAEEIQLMQDTVPALSFAGNNDFSVTYTGTR